MPKELTHWWLAAAAADRLPPASPARCLLATHRAAWLAGAVLPDTLLHLIAGPAAATALRLGTAFHEPTGSSYAPLIRFLERQESGDKGQTPGHPFPLAPPVIACLLGVACHIEADVAFHPLICSLAPDCAAHYRVETELDLWLLASGRKPPVRQLRELLQQPEAYAAALTTLAGLFDPQGALEPYRYRQALRLHQLIQGMYGNPGWQLLAWLAAQLPVAALRRYRQLFYPLRWRQGRPFPRAGGVDLQPELERRAGQAVHRVTGLLLQCDAQGLLAALRNQPGEHLISGRAPLVHTATADDATALP